MSNTESIKVDFIVTKIIRIRDDVLKDKSIFFDSLYFFLKALNRLNSDIKAFYGTGESLEEALQYKFMELEHGLSKDQTLIDKVLKFWPMVAVWDGHPIDHYSTAITFFKLETSVVIEISATNPKINNKQRILNFFNEVLAKYDVIFMNAVTSSRFVFKDRPSPGWMMFLKTPVQASALRLKNASEVIQIDNDKNKGILTISTGENMPNSTEALKHVDELGIELVELDLLPTHKQLAE